MRKDPGEHVDLALEFPEVVEKLWRQLNTTILTQRDCNGWSYQGGHGQIPGPIQPDGVTTSCSPSSLLGTCNETCANKKWETYGQIRDKGPMCGVPGCV